MLSGAKHLKHFFENEQMQVLRFAQDDNLCFTQDDTHVAGSEGAGIEGA